MGMLRCGPTRSKVCVVFVITKGKLPVKYANIRKRLEEGKIVITFVSNYFYRYRFGFFNYHCRFHLGLNKNQKKLENDFQKPEIIIFVFIPTFQERDFFLRELSSISYSHASLVRAFLFTRMSR
jgi:hypothetical protein